MPEERVSATVDNVTISAAVEDGLAKGVSVIVRGELHELGNLFDILTGNKSKMVAVAQMLTPDERAAMKKAALQLMAEATLYRDRDRALGKWSPEIDPHTMKPWAPKTEGNC